MIKRRIVVAALAALAVTAGTIGGISTPVDAHSELLDNPSFEGDFSELAPGWVENTWGDGANGFYEPSYSVVHSGNSSQKLTVCSLGDGGVQFYQSFETAPGVEYQGSAWLRSDEEIEVEVILRLVGYPYSTISSETVTVGSDWIKVTTQGSNEVSVEAGLFIVALSTGTLYIDDAALSSVDGPVDPPIEEPPGFSVSNGRIIAPDGTDFVARGINIYNSTFFPNDSPTKGADAVGEIVGLFPKINMIRVAYQDDDENNLYWASTARDDQFLASFVEAATARRIVVLLEDHSTIGNFTWTQGQVDTYTTLAERYKDNPYVWFATENEPDAAPGERIAQNARATYDAIRSTGNNNMVLLLSRGGGYTDEIVTYGNYISGGPVPNYPDSGPGAGGSDVSAMHNVAWDMHFYMWANPSATVAEVEDALWNGIDTRWGPFAGINVYRNGPQSADGVMPVIVGEWGKDWAGENVQEVILQTGADPYPVGSLAWNWSAGDPDILVSGDTRTPYGDAVNAFIDAGTGVPEPTQP